ncbi:maleylpyruvate isomerase N-terminal domain-containing protein [Nisaea sp.]|uniref:maleylpyruvate isomerase N-terminal domain-containing protein n=1 Tax=Nisaea sp. TaxID=2024842 RepID=UPI0032EDC91B
MSDSLEAERAALRARLGSGARYDSPAAPAEDLILARRGTAYFARKLNELTDRDLDAPSLVSGWTRRHLVAHIGYHARALTRLADWGRTGIETPMHASAEERDAEIGLGATLPAQALRHLFTHSAVHLNVVWRDLEDTHWDAPVRTLDGSVMELRDLPMLRAREIWHRALALGNGGAARDLPAPVRDPETGIPTEN